MCANRNTNLLKKTSLVNNFIKYRNDILMIIQTSFPALAYTLLLLSQSFSDMTLEFSTALAVFSGCITITFEINEWKTYFSKVRKKRKKNINFFPPLLLSLIMFTIAATTYRPIVQFLNIPAAFLNVMPNLITSLTLFLYFSSYTIRLIKIRHYEYSTQKNY